MKYVSHSSETRHELSSIEDGLRFSMQRNDAMQVNIVGMKSFEKCALCRVKNQGCSIEFDIEFIIIVCPITSLAIGSKLRDGYY